MKLMREVNRAFYTQTEVGHWEQLAKQKVSQAFICWLAKSQKQKSTNILCDLLYKVQQ